MGFGSPKKSHRTLGFWVLGVGVPKARVSGFRVEESRDSGVSGVGVA